MIFNAEKINYMGCYYIYDSFDENKKEKKEKNGRYMYHSEEFKYRMVFNIQKIKKTLAHL